MRSSLAFLALSLTGCSELAQAYRQEQEFVLYDASKAPPAAGTPAADFARLREAESLRAEVAQLITEGLDAEGALTKKLTELDAAILTQRTALGADFAKLRAARAAELCKPADAKPTAAKPDGR